MLSARCCACRRGNALSTPTFFRVCRLCLRPEIVVDVASVQGPAIPRNFIGFSMEVTGAPRMLGPGGANVAFAQTLLNLHATSTGDHAGDHYARPRSRLRPPRLPRRHHFVQASAEIKAVMEVCVCVGGMSDAGNEGE